MRNEWTIVVWWYILLMSMLCVRLGACSNLNLKRILDAFKDKVIIFGMGKINIRDMIRYFKSFFIRLSAVLSYSLFGATVFYFLEQRNGEDKQLQAANLSFIINNAKRKLNENMSSAELYGLSKDLYNLASKVDNEYQTQLDKIDQFFSWVYFCLTTIMTIGYGDITPKTNKGKLFLLFYGAPGIALMVLLLAFCAQMQTTLIHALVKKLNIHKERRKRNNGNSKYDEYKVFFFSIILLIPVEVVAVLLVFKRTNWSAINCMYFWFCTVTTIGFGDLVVPDHEAATVVPWLLMKTLTLAVMAGVINSLAVVLQKRKIPKVRCSKKKEVVTQNEIELN